MIIPADIPQNMHATFQQNYNAITKNTDLSGTDLSGTHSSGSEKLFLFAGDHKLEKLNQINPERFFELAAEPEIGCFATHLGLIARYGKQYPNVNYIVKLNGKSNLLKTLTGSGWNSGNPNILQDPLSRQLWNVDDVVSFQKNSGLNIRGVGYTVYLGSSFEAEMLKEAAQMVFQAHQHGLVAILWMYPRGYSVYDDLDGDVIAGAAGVAAELGADFVKVKIPRPSRTSAEYLQKAVQSAGNTKVICSGGEKENAEDFLAEIEHQLTKGGIAGCAVGRNIFEHELPQAKEMIKKLGKLIHGK